MNPMVEFKVQVEEDIVKEYGKDTLEKYLQEYLTKAILSLAAKEILDDLKTIDIKENAFLQAREKAWNDYGKHYFLKVSSN
jgi:hypothetical protein